MNKRLNLFFISILIIVIGLTVFLQHQNIPHEEIQQFISKYNRNFVLAEEGGILYAENIESRDRVPIVDILILAESDWYLSNFTAQKGVLLSPSPNNIIVFSLITTRIDEEKGILGSSKVYTLDLLNPQKAANIYNDSEVGEYTLEPINWTDGKITLAKISKYGRVVTRAEGLIIIFSFL